VLVEIVGFVGELESILLMIIDFVERFSALSRAINVYVPFAETV